MAMVNCTPTKTNLLRLKSELNFAQQGYELLDQKRNILIIELLGIVDQTAEIQSRVEDLLKQAYKAMEETIFDMGKLKVQYVIGSVNIEADINIGPERLWVLTFQLSRQHLPTIVLIIVRWEQASGLTIRCNALKKFWNS